MKVLIPIDGSKASYQTIRESARFLDRRNTEIYFYTAVIPVEAEVPWSFYVTDDDAVRMLQQAETEARNAGLNVVKTEHQNVDEPAAAICQYAENHGVDAILMGSHGYHGIARLLIGSVSERVFKQAKQPVIIVRNDKEHSIEVSHAGNIGLNQAR